jgi:hypothetical protein
MERRNMSDKKVAIVSRKMLPGTDWVISSVTEIPAGLKDYEVELFADNKKSKERDRSCTMFREFNQQEWKHEIMPLVIEQARY